ncbi:MAG TPA: universal stress protein [Chthoniobacterales bacterium]|jgi:universal stress protein A|nr:universal stress protein [Chthoniobacterales bacterium]
MIDETTPSNSSQPSQESVDPVEQVQHIVTLKRILAPTDLTIHSRKAVDYAIAIGEHFNSQVTLLHVYVAPDPEDYSREIHNYRFVDQARTALDMLWSRLRLRYPNIDTELRCGAAQEQIVAAAKDLNVDLIVLSTHRYNWFSRLVDGSEAEYVFRHAPCPILVIRNETKDFIEASDGSVRAVSSDKQ